MLCHRAGKRAAAAVFRERERIFKLVLGTRFSSGIQRLATKKQVAHSGTQLPAVLLTRTNVGIAGVDLQQVG